jgi:hypothetical protein
MNNNNKKNITKTSRGYRLKDSTHSMIEKIQLLINGNKDTVISRAVRMYYNQIINERKNIILEIKKSNN